MRFAISFLAGLSVLLLVSCTGGQTVLPYQAATGGDAREGKKVIQAYGCGACHVIPGVHAANGMVGPPLYFFSRRTMIAGELPNTPQNLVRWIQNPPSVEAATAMPDLGLSDQQARDAAAYLYTLR